MRSPFLNLFRESPFIRLLEHAEKIQEGGPMFRKAISCYLEGRCAEFESLHMEVTKIESEADSIKRNIRGHLPRGLMMPVDKFQFLWYLREQDKVMDALEDALHWLSFRTTLVPAPLVEDLLLMVDKALEIIDQLPLLVNQAIRYFGSFAASDRETLKNTVHDIRHTEFQSDQIERKLKSDIFAQKVADPGATFHLIRMVEYIGEVSNHAENAADMMRVMIAR